MSDTETTEYLLGDDDQELQRLAIQHRVWAEPTYASWRRAGFGVGDTVLDLGCGPGFTSLDLAEWVGPTGRVIAFDQSTHFLQELERQVDISGYPITTQAGDVSELLLPASSLDGVYARWLFCFLSNPAEVVYDLFTALKPGARLVTLDYFNYEAFTLAPRSAAMDEVVSAVQAHWRLGGGSLDVQGDMPGIMADCGLEVVEVRQVSGVARPGSPQWAWPEAFLRHQLPRMVEQQALGAELIEEFWRDWEVAAGQPESYLYLPPLLEIHGRKPDR